MRASRIVIQLRKVAPGRERAIALRSFPDWPALPSRGFGIGALSPRRVGCVGASLTLAGKLRGMTLARHFPVLSRKIESLDGLPQGGAGSVVGKALAHLFLFALAQANRCVGTMRAAHAACHGASRVGGAP